MIEILSLILFAGIFVFFYFYLARAFKAAGIDLKELPVKITVIALAAIFGIVLSEIVGIGAVFSLHLMVFALIMRLINNAVNRSTKSMHGTGIERKSGAVCVWHRVFASGLVPLVAAFSVVIGGYVNMNNVVCTRFEVNTNKSISRMYTVALIADVHFGISVDIKELRRICDEVSAKKPDIVALCGDIVDENTSADDMRAVFAALGQITSTFGTYYVYGNHDRQPYTNDKSFTADELNAAIESNGITILCDETALIGDEIALIGREDISAGKRKDIKELTANAPQNRYVISLDHQPREYKTSARAGVDLVLSGHTHAGQIWPMDMLFSLTTSNEAIYGTTHISADSFGVVTSGLAGWGFPVKTSAPAEYAVIEIKGK